MTVSGKTNYETAGVGREYTIRNMELGHRTVTHTKRRTNSRLDGGAA
jgi:hypothetical protein